jgi:hypothetical protein
MASSNVLTYVLVGGAAYVAYTWYKSQPAAGTTGSTSAPTIGASVMDAADLATYVAAQRAAGATDAQIQAALNAMAAAQVLCISPSVWNTSTGTCKKQTSSPQTLAQLLTAAAGTGAAFGLDIDQWLYYYNQLPGRTPVTGDQVDQMLSKSGVARSSPQSVDYFVGMLNSVGLSGFGGYLPRPVFVNRGFGGGYGLADLRRAGGRY